MYLIDLDLSIFHAINGYCGQNWLRDAVATVLEDNNLIKSALFIGTFYVFWFQPAPHQAQRHASLTITVIGAMLSLVIARAIAFLLPFRLRPLGTPDIDYHAPLSDESSSFDLENWSSFPSDHATFFFAMVTGFWFFSKRWAIFLAIFTVVVVLLPRIYLGIHYPSDVLAGALLGIGVALAINCDPVRKLVAVPLVAIQQRMPAYYNCLVFLIVFEAGNMFDNVRSLGKVAKSLFEHYSLN